MIRRYIKDDQCTFYDDGIEILKIHLLTRHFTDYVIVQIDNKFRVLYQITADYYEEIYHLCSDYKPNIIYTFPKCELMLHWKNNVYYLIDSNYDMVITSTNMERDMVKYALNQIRIQKLKTII